MVDFPTPIQQKRRCHENARAEILCRMHRSAYSQLSRGLFPWRFLCLCLGAKKLIPIPKSAIVTKPFAPKFFAEWSDREIHSSHGDDFRDHFCVYVSGPRSWLRYQKASSSQRRSHRASVQNGPVDKFTALTATIFMTISARLELLPGCPVDHKAKAARLELLPGCPVGAARLAPSC